MNKLTQEPAKLIEAKTILRELGLPPKQQNDISALTLLALCRMSYKSSWSEARAESLTIRKGIMDHVDTVLQRKYAENSRESFRRQVLHQFVQAAVVIYNPDSPDLPVNSSRAHYKLSSAALAAIRTFGTNRWANARDKFIQSQGSLVTKYAAEREMSRVSMTLSSGEVFKLSPGRHNQLQAAIVEEFAPRFAPGSKLLYLGDTETKALHIDSAGLKRVGITIDEHSKLPDIVLHYEPKNWLIFVEAVTAHGPMTPKRVAELKAILTGGKAGPVFVSAFLDIAQFKIWAADIAWETEVWLADNPSHMLHFNGDRFLGPH